MREAIFQENFQLNPMEKTVWKVNILQERMLAGIRKMDIQKTNIQAIDMRKNI